MIDSDSAVVSLTITNDPANPDPITAVDDTATTAEDTLVSIDVLANDLNPDGNTLTLTILTQPTNGEGTAFVNTADIVEFTPTTNFVGVATFTYEITDGTSTSTASVTVTVTAVNDPITAVDDSFSVVEEAPTDLDVVANDIFIDEGETITITITSPPSHGTISPFPSTFVSATGGSPTSFTLTYTSNTDYIGTDSFEYTLTTASGDNDSAVVSLTITNDPDPITAVDDTATTAEDTLVSIDVLANDVNPDGNTLTLTILTQPINGEGTAFVNTADIVEFTPTTNFVGVATFTYEITDGTSTSTASVTVTVTAVNDPITAVDDSFSVVEEAPTDLDVVANDIFIDEGETITITVISSPSHGTISPFPSTFVSATGGSPTSFTLTYTSDTDYIGTDSFEYTLTTANGDNDSAVVSLTITNDPDPITAVDDTATTAEDTLVSIDVLANDVNPDGNTLTLTILTQPTNGEGTAFVNTADIVEFTPTTNFVGVATFTYEITDGASTSTASVTVTVTAVNDPITAVDDSFSVVEEAPTDLDVVANDIFIDEGETITITITSPPSHGTISPFPATFVSATGGSPTSFTLTYTSDTDYIGTDSFAYTLTTANGDNDSAVVSLTITNDPANPDPVTAVDDTATTAEDTLVSIDVLANDLNPDGNTLTLTILTQPTNGEGTAFVNTADIVEFTPTTNFVGVATFTYEITDGASTSTASVTVTVTAVNDPITAVDDNFSVVEEAPTDLDVVANDIFIDEGETITITVSITPSHGTISPFPSTFTSATGGSPTSFTLTYTSDTDYIGTDSFEYTLTTANGDNDSAVVSLTITNDPDPITAVDDTATTTEDTLVSIDVLANDLNPDGNTLTLTILTQPTNGEGNAVVNTADIVEFTPTTNFVGVATFTYEITDGASTSTASVTVTVTAVNDPITAVDDNFSVVEEAPTDLDVVANDIFIDEGETITITITSPPSHGTISPFPSTFTSATGGSPTSFTLTYTSDTDYIGTDSFEYTLTTASGDSDSAVVSLTITNDPANPDPVTAVDDTATTAEDTLVSIDVLANDLNPDGNTLTLTILTQPTNGEGNAVVNTADIVEFTPATNFVGVATFTYEITDGTSTSTASVTVTVTAVNDPITAVDDSFSVVEEAPTDLDVVANDIFIDEGETITITVISSPSHGTISPFPSTFTSATGGSPTSFTLTYTSDTDYIGTDSFEYTLTTANGDNDSAVVSLTITNDPANPDPVTAVDDTATTAEDTLVSIDVLANDLNPDGNTLTLTILTQPTNGEGNAVVNTADIVEFTPATNFNGVATFTYEITDGTSTSTASVTVTVTAVNDPITAVDDSFTVVEEVPTNLDVVANDILIDEGETITITVSITPSHGTISPFPSTFTSATGGSPTSFTLTYTSDTDYIGTDSFAYTLTTASGDNDSAVVSLTITNDPANPDPITAVDDTATTAEDTLVSIDVLANDLNPDGNTLTLTILTQPTNGEGNAVVNTADIVEFTPATNFNGVATFTYEITDGTSTSTASVTVTVTAVNDPITAVDDNFSVVEEAPTDLDVVANDILIDEGETITITITSSPSHGTISPFPSTFTSATGGSPTSFTLTYTSNTDYIGTDSFEYTLTTASGDNDSAVVSLTITNDPANPDPVIANDDNAATAEDTQVEIDVLANDSNPDQMPLTITIINQPSTGEGNVVVNGESPVIFTPGNNFTGTTTFIYQITDGSSTSSATVTVTVTAVNDPITAIDDNFVVTEQISANLDVVGNDILIDEGETITILITNSPSHGIISTTLPATFTSATGGSTTSFVLTYTSTTDYFGTDSFEYTLTTASGDNDSAVVYIDILNDTANPDPVVAVDDNAATAEDTQVEIDVLANDSNPDQMPLTITIINQPSEPGSGSVYVNAANRVVYIPNSNFTETTTFTYQISDGNSVSSASVTVFVAPVNDGITAIDDFFVVIEDTPANLDVVQNDLLIDENEMMTISIASGPSHGTITTPFPATFTSLAPATTNFVINYSPDLNYVGTDSFVYTITSMSGDSDSAIVSIQIMDNATLDPPIAVDDIATTPEDVSVTIDVLANDSNPDGTPLTISVPASSQPANGLAVPMGNSIAYTPDTDFNGIDVFTYTISSSSGSSTATVTVNVIPVDDSYVAVDDYYDITEDTITTLAITDNDSINMNTFTIVVEIPPLHGAAVISTNPQEIDYTPDTDYFGSDSFVYKVITTSRAETTATVYLNVINVNDAPVANNDFVVIDEDTPTFIDVLSNDVDVDGDYLEIIIATTPTNGIASIHSINQTIYYRPNTHFTGTDSFNYTIEDPSNSTSVATVFIDVIPINDEVEAIDDFVAVQEGSNTDIFVLINDNIHDDTSIDTITLGIISQPTYGNITIIGSSANVTSYGFNYDLSANPNYFGTDSFVYIISSSPEGDTSTATVRILITPTDDLILAIQDFVITAEEVPVDIDVLNNDINPDGDNLIITIVTPPTTGTANVQTNSNTIYYNPGQGFSGTETFVYQIDDGVNTSTATVTVTVQPVNDGITVIDDAYLVLEDTPTDLSITANDLLGSDPSEILTFRISYPPSHGILDNYGPTNFTDPSTFSVEYTPDINYFGIDTFEYTITTDSGDSDSGVVTIRVFPQNDTIAANDDIISTQEDTPIEIQVLFNDVSPDGVRLYIVQTTQPGNGLAVVNDYTTITYTPDENYVGTDTFVYTIQGSNGSTSTATVLVTVLAVDDGIEAVDDEFYVLEDTTNNLLDVLSNDLNPDSLILNPIQIVLAPTHGTAIVNVGGADINYSPNPDFSGVDTFIYRITDQAGLYSDTAIVTIYVSDVNDGPSANDDFVVIDEDTPTFIDVLSNDVDLEGDDFSIIISTTPTNGFASIHSINQTIYYRPNTHYTGTDSFDYTIEDSSGLISTATVFIDVIPINDGVEAIDDFVAVQEGSNTDIFVLINDNIHDDTSIDTITLGIISQPTYGNITIIGSSANVTSYGFNYDLSANPNYFGTDSFVYIISSSPEGDTSTATVRILITPTDDLILAIQDFVITAEEVPVDIDVLNNDINPDGDDLIITIVTPPTTGTANVQTNSNTIYYNPGLNFSGTETFVYQIDDGVNTSTATVTVTVQPVNDGITVIDDAYLVLEDTPTDLSITANDLLGSDPSEILTFRISYPPSHGILDNYGPTNFTDPSTFSVEYTPDINYFGIDTFEYTITTASGDSDSGVVTIRVFPQNDTIAANDDIISTQEDTPIEIQVLFNDVSPDGVRLYIVQTTQPANGFAVINDHTTITYTPDENYVGTDTFVYTIQAPNGSTSTATVLVTVLPRDDGIEAVDDEFYVLEDTTNNLLDVLSNDLNPDSLILNPIEIVFLPIHGTAIVNVGGADINYSPNPDFSGVDTFIYRITDQAGLYSDTAIVTIYVSDINDPIQANDDTIVIREDTPAVIDVLANDDNPDGDDATVAIIVSPAHGTAYVNANQTVTYIPDPNYHGPDNVTPVDTFIYMVTDEEGATATATVFIIIFAMNDGVIAVDDVAFTNIQRTIIIPVTENDIDPDNGVLTVTINTTPSGGNVTTDGTTITYTPSPYFIGTDVFSYNLTSVDPEGNIDSDIAIVTVTVLPSSCPCGMELNITNGLCNFCEPGSFSSGFEQCDHCPPGFITVIGGQCICTDCGPGSTNAPNRTACIPCPEGTFSPGTGDCGTCPPGTVTALSNGAATGGASECVPCPCGTQQVGNECVYCPVNTVSVVPGELCDFCPPGHVGGLGQCVCTDCGPGREAREASTTNATLICQPCLPGMFSSGTGQCTACPPGYIAPSVGALECYPCPCGYGSNGTTCLPCGAGTFSTGGEQCDTCPPGTYTVQEGQCTCTDCGAGFESDDARQLCLPCEAGSFSSGPGQCVECRNGTVSKLGSTTCYECGCGTQALANLTDCEYCPPGQYSANGGRCDICPPGTVAQLEGQCECTICGVGYQANANHTECVPCPPGTSNSILGGLCLPCEDGFFSTDGIACYLCACGSQFENVTTCSLCEPGTFSPEGGRCDICPPGTYATLPGQCTCDSCGPGQQANFNNTGCEPCEAGFFSPGDGQCFECQNGTISLAGSTIMSHMRMWYSTKQ